MSTIVNPLTDKEVSAFGKVAKKLYKMHIDKHIKLAPKTLSVLKKNFSKQQGGTNNTKSNVLSRTEVLLPDVKEYILNKMKNPENLKNAAKLQLISKIVSQDVIENVIDRYVKMALEANTPQKRLDLIKKTFGEQKVKSSNLETQVIKIILEQLPTIKEIWDIDEMFTEFAKEFDNEFKSVDANLFLLNLASKKDAINKMAEWESWWEFSKLHYILEDHTKLELYQNKINDLYQSNDGSDKFLEFEINDKTKIQDLYDALHSIPLYFKVYIGY